MSSSDEEYGDENNPCRPTKRRKLPNSLIQRNTDHTSLTHDEVGLKDHLFFALHRPTHMHNETTDSHINRCDGADTPNEAHRLMIYGDAIKIESVNEVMRRRVEGEEAMQTLQIRSTSYGIEDDAPSASLELVTLDRFDVRLLIDQAEWLTRSPLAYEPQRSDSAITSSSEESHTDVTIMEHSNGDHGESALDCTGYRTSATSAELLAECMNGLEWERLQYERFRDLTQSSGDNNRNEETPSIIGHGESISEVDEISSLDAEEINDELVKRRRLASKGREWQYEYDPPVNRSPFTSTISSASIPLSSTSSASSSSTLRKVPPPPPTRKRPPPPPPRQTNKLQQSPANTTALTNTPTEISTAPTFKLPFSVPDGITVPHDFSLHRIISHTVRYILSLGPLGGQQEILLKVKQSNNRSFYFLNFDHPLHTYYQWLKDHPVYAEQAYIQTIEEMNSSHSIATNAIHTSTKPNSNEPSSYTNLPISTNESSQPSGTSVHTLIDSTHLAAPPSLSSAPVSSIFRSGGRPPPGMKLKADRLNRLNCIESGPPTASIQTSTHPIPAFMQYEDEEDPIRPNQFAALSTSPPAAAATVSSISIRHAQNLAHHHIQPPPASFSSSSSSSSSFSSLSTSSNHSSLSSLLHLPLPSSLLHLLPPPPNPIPPLPILDAIHEFVSIVDSRGGVGYETLTRAQERNNPKFEFLRFESIHHPYYQWLKTIQPIIAIEKRQDLLHSSGDDTLP